MFLSRSLHAGTSAPALHDASGWCSYVELQGRVDQLAAALADSRKLLAFCFCRNDIPSVSWYLAALKAGHAVALLNSALPHDASRRLIELYSPDLILAAEDGDWGPAYDVLPPLGRNFGWKRRTPSEMPLHPALGVLLSTSGSTGSPKFVRLTPDNILSNAESIVEALDIRAEDRSVSSLPFHYSYGLSVLNTHLLAGASMVLTDEGLMTPAFWSAVRDHGCTSFAGVPYSYQILNRLKLDELNVPSLVTMTQAGGKLNDELILKFHRMMADRGGRFFVMYGQTEATARIAVLPPSRLPEKAGSAGVAIPRGALAVDAAPGELGELIYTGPNVMMGYANRREDLALGDELGGRLATGDMARLDADGFVYISGRMKRDAKIFGLRINLDEVETMLRPRGPTAVVSGGDRLLIYCEHGDEAAYQRYAQELAQRLNVAFRAFHFRRIDALPVGPNGKIDYRALETLPR